MRTTRTITPVSRQGPDRALPTEQRTVRHQKLTRKTTASKTSPPYEDGDNDNATWWNLPFHHTQCDRRDCVAQLIAVICIYCAYVIIGYVALCNRDYCLSLSLFLSPQLFSILLICSLLYLSQSTPSCMLADDTY